MKYPLHILSDRCRAAWVVPGNLSPFTPWWGRRWRAARREGAASSWAAVATAAVGDDRASGERFIFFVCLSWEAVEQRAWVEFFVCARQTMADNSTLERSETFDLGLWMVQIIWISASGAFKVVEMTLQQKLTKEVVRTSTMLQPKLMSWK